MPMHLNWVSMLCIIGTGEDDQGMLVHVAEAAQKGAFPVSPGEGWGNWTLENPFLPVVRS